MYYFLGFFIGICVTVNTAGFISGVRQANNKYFTNCHQTSRLDYIFPGYKLGCWMNKDLNNN